MEWLEAALQSTFCISTRDGKRYPIAGSKRNRLGQFSFSPANEYLIYYDYAATSYFCHDLKTGVEKEIGKDINESLSSYLGGDHVYPDRKSTRLNSSH